MPEGVEVYIITQQLYQILHNARLLNINVLNKTIPIYKKFNKDISKQLIPYLKNDLASIIFSNIKSKGKFIYFELELTKKNEPDKHFYKYIGNHLAMTGNWRKEKSKHMLLSIQYIKDDIEGEIYFDDMRHFSKMYLLNKDEILKKLAELGPDILSKNFTRKAFIDILNDPTNKNKIIASLLVDQKIISGIGNYLRADILYIAKIHPKEKISNLTLQQQNTLFSAIKKIVQKDLSEHGTTIRTYKDVNMEVGNYHPIIYGQSKDPYGNPVKKMTINNRTMWWVPKVQKLLD